MVVYDITNMQTYQSIKRWISEVRSMTEPDTVLIMVGNKVDICTADPSTRKISKSEAEKFASDNNMLFIESSAQECNNVREAFEVLLQTIYTTTTKEKDVRSKHGMPIQDNHHVVEKSIMCC